MAGREKRILAQLIEKVLGYDFEGFDRTIDVHIKNLRRKLAAAGAGEGCGIVTVYGVGYKIKEPDRA